MSNYTYIISRGSRHINRYSGDESTCTEHKSAINNGTYGLINNNTARVAPYCAKVVAETTRRVISTSVLQKKQSRGLGILYCRPHSQQVNQQIASKYKVKNL